MKQLLAILILAIILIAGCTQTQTSTGQVAQQTKYVCSDGSTVYDPNLCPKKVSSVNQTEMYPKSDEIASKTLKYVNENLVETGKTASLTSIEKFNSLYNTTFSYQGRVVSIFVTIDGNYVFLSAPIIMNGTVAGTKPEDIASKTLKYINENLVQAGTTASYVFMADFEGLYNITVAYQGKDVSVFSTKDGNYVFLSSPLNMNEKFSVQTTSTSPQSYGFQSYENQEPYYSTYCDKINPYDLNVRKAAADAIRNHPGSYNVNQLFDIYDWVKQNIIYQNVPLAGIPYSPSDTLTTKSGDCKNQAVLIASMVRSIGGTAKVVLDPTCEHAYAIVYFGSSVEGMDNFVQAVANHYGTGVQVNYITSNNGIWVYFDPAGGNYPGNLLNGCSGNRIVYFITSCLDCVNQYPDKPYTFGDKCYSQCPSGTITANQYACKSCPEGSYSCNNQCLYCPTGEILGTDCLCHSH